MIKMIVAIVFFLCVTSINPFASPGGRAIADADWMELGQAQGIQSWAVDAFFVKAITVDTLGNLYAGGIFYGAGGILTGNRNEIVKWDGITWSAMPCDSPYTIFGVACFAGPGGNLYAPVSYGTPTQHDFVKWDGNKWILLESGFNRCPYSIDANNAVAVDRQGNLYIGGKFDSAGGIVVNNIAKWDGTAWSGLGSGINLNGLASIEAIAIDSSGNVYAGGRFDSAGSKAVRNIAKWDGAQWNQLGSGVNGGIRALSIDKDGAVFAGGQFDTAGEVLAHNVAKWNGNGWSPLGNGVRTSENDDPIVEVLAFDGAGILYAGGRFDTAGGAPAQNLAKWDGFAWRTLGNGGGYSDDNYNNAVIEALAFGKNGKVYAGGCFTNIGGTVAENIAQWNGSSWSAVGCPAGKGLNGFVYACAADAKGNIYAGGLFNSAGIKGLSQIGKWNGSDWIALGDGIAGSTLFGVFAVAVGRNDVLYAGGRFEGAGGIAVRNIAKWDGERWSPLGSGLSGRNNWVYTLALDNDGNLYAGGDFSVAGSTDVNAVAKWDGSSWSALGGSVGNRYGGVNALAFDKEGVLFAGGNFDTMGGKRIPHVAQWNGNEWNPLGSGINGVVSAIAIDGSGIVYAGGRFDTAGGVAARNIARWNGTSWSPLGNGVGKDVSALAIDREGILYCGGYFDTAGVLPARCLARWNGSEWAPLGSGVDDWVHGLVVDGAGNLYAGGRFGVAGEKTSPRFAICRTGGVKTITPDKGVPFRSIFSLSGDGCVHLELKTSSTVDIRIYSLSGREIVHTSSDMPQGRHVFSIRHLKSVRGVYIARVSAGGETGRWKVVLER
jgi:hypothetical protein